LDKADISGKLFNEKIGKYCIESLGKKVVRMERKFLRKYSIL